MASAPTSRSGWNSAPHVPPTQCTGQIPPSFSKCGVDSGCQSCEYTTNAPASRAAAISALTTAGTSSPPRTYSDPFGSAKSFCTSTTSSAVRESYSVMAVRWDGASWPDSDASADLDHSLDGGAGTVGDLGLDPDLVDSFAEGSGELGRRAGRGASCRRWRGSACARRAARPGLPGTGRRWRSRTPGG